MGRRLSWCALGCLRRDPWEELGLGPAVPFALWAPLLTVPGSLPTVALEQSHLGCILLPQRPSEARWGASIAALGGIGPPARIRHTRASSRLWPHPTKSGNYPEHLGLGGVRNKNFFKDGYFKNRTNRHRPVAVDQGGGWGRGVLQGSVFPPVLWTRPHAARGALGAAASGLSGERSCGNKEMGSDGPDLEASEEFPFVELLIGGKHMCLEAHRLGTL